MEEGGASSQTCPSGRQPSGVEGVVRQHLGTNTDMIQISITDTNTDDDINTNIHLDNALAQFEQT